ncbi:MAG: hypothetical protein ABSD90_16165, partial [Methylocystis sp.]
EAPHTAAESPFHQSCRRDKSDLSLKESPRQIDSIILRHRLSEFVQNARPTLGREGAFVDAVDELWIHGPPEFRFRRREQSVVAALSQF